MMLRNRFYLVLAGILAVVVVSGWAFSAAVATVGNTAVHQDSDYDDQIANANKKAKSVQNQLDDVESELEDTDIEIVSTNRKIVALEGKLPTLRKELDTANERLNAAKVQQKIVADKLKAAKAQDEDITRQIAADNERIDELKVTLGALARDQYMGQRTSDSLSLVFGAESSSEFVNEFAAQQSAARVSYNALDEIETIAAQNRNRGARQDAVRDYITDLKSQADALVKEADAARTLAKQKKAEVDKALTQLAALKADLAAQRVAAIAKQDELEKQQDAVRNTVRELVKKKLAAERAAGHTGSGLPIGKGYLNFPTKVPHITSTYGMRYHPVLHYWRLHAGTDFRAYCGTPIYSAAAGKVEWAKRVGGFGNQVMLDHGIVKGNSLMSSYNHLSRYSVHTGQYVAQGQLLGYAGATGTVTACHLHFEVYVNGDTVDPMTILGPIP